MHPGQVFVICNHKQFISNDSFNLICYICMKQFESKCRLKDHMNIHDAKEKPHFCRSCEQGFSSKFNYNRHVLQNHTDLTEEYNCAKCEATFTLERNLERHIQVEQVKHTS
jgi:KRAB domain-containing zinc finger protein